jgi:serine/threonine protein kinase
MTLGEAKKLARLAVKRFGVNEEGALRALHDAWKAKRRGEELDIIGALEKRELIDHAQAADLYSAARRNGIDVNHAPTAVQLQLKAPRPPTTARRSGLLPAVAANEIGGYRLLRKLGEGAMADVHLARSPSGELFAIKLLNQHVADDNNLLQRFKREAEQGMRLNHPNIVRIHGSGFDPDAGRHFILMEYIDGPSTHQLLAKLGKLALGDALRIALDLAHGLEFIHGRNIVHRDIKPENVLINSAGIAKLTDLGLCKDINQPSNLTQAKAGFGTPYYMPHEQAVSAKAVDGRSDLFALGATLYHWLTGQVPFDGANHVEVLERKNEGAFIPASFIEPTIPEEIDLILGRLMARLPEERYQTASELIVELERSGLVAPTLSFVDQKLALSDPNVQLRAVQAQQPTVKDLTIGTDRQPAVKIWYVKFLDGQGKPKALMATTHVLLKAVARGQVPRGAEASRSKKGPFEPLTSLPEFQGRIQPPKPKPKSLPRIQATPRPLPVQEPYRLRLTWPLLLIGLGVVGLLAALALYFAR